ncbi:DUF1617 family protein [Bacillus suaedae]|uniref:DUF1617 family protein n=1 Tax=Halalkalibacter suaedae TaxID=2822140 RepID=A0A940WXW2_9BACI|nr:DUF1617 family protein [Bacillus suaedae]MBP3950346.1 DUF1617 family protein [Bacillus suaedae]
MLVKIQNKFIKDAINFLYDMSLKGKKSRHRTRLISLLQEKMKQIGEEEVIIIKEFAGEDKEGNPKKDDNGNFAINDVKACQEQLNELWDEFFIIDGGDAHGMLKTVKEVIEDYDGELSGRQAEVYDHLFDAFEQPEEEKEDE